MRAALVCLLLVLPAAAQERRTPEQILADHAGALGDVLTVGTLRALLDTGDGRTTNKGATTIWRLPGASARTIPMGNDATRREFFGRDGAFLTHLGHFERFRPGQETTRGGYYLFKALAEPFPLLAYLKDLRLQATLQLARAAGREVLVSPPDEHDMRTSFVLDPKTHLLEEVRYGLDPNHAHVRVRYADYRAVEGVVLPRVIDAVFYLAHEHAESGTLKTLKYARRESIHRWEINPPLADDAFAPPGRSGRPAPGFVRTVHATGLNPYEVAGGDLDGDGAPDFAAACHKGVMVHFGGAYGKPVFVALGGGQCRGLVCADLDCDGRDEILTTSNIAPATTFFVVSFDAARTPAVSSIYGAPRFAHAIVADDFDLDGVPDWAATGFEGARELAVKFGNGAKGVRRTGTSWPLNADDRQRRGLGLAVGDIDGNRYKDIAVADGRRVLIFLGQVNGSFQPRASIPDDPVPQVAWRPVAVALVDLDSDGDDDLVVAREHPTMRDLPVDLVLVENDRGRLSVTKHINAGERIQSVASGHLNGDAHPDVVVTSLLSGEISVLYGDGKGGLSDPVRMGSGRGSCRLFVGDLDRNGRDDIVVANRLDDTVALFRNEASGPVRPGPPRARAAPPPTEHDFRLEGLTDPFAFAGEFRIPADIEDPSGLVCLAGDGAHVQFALVSDKRSALFRMVLDRGRKRLLVGPPIPLRGLENERLDLEGMAFDPSGNLFLGCEADSSVLRVTLFGDVVDRAHAQIASGGNDGIEALAVRRLKDGTPLLYVFKERNGTTLEQPVVHAYGLEESPFKLVPRALDLKLPVPVVDQTGAAVFGDRLFVLHRMARGIVEVGFDDDGFAPDGARAASYLALAAALGLRSPRTPIYGMMEALAIEPFTGDLFLLLDNNRQAIGRKRRNHGAEGRLLWFRNLGAATGATRPPRVAVRHLRIGFRGAKRDDGIERDRDAAGRRARAALERLRAGDPPARLAEAFHDPVAELPGELRIVIGAFKPKAGEVSEARLPRALARLAFNLEVGESGICEFHFEESPYGYHVVERIQ